MVFWKMAILGSDFDLKFDLTLAQAPLSLIAWEQSHIYEVKAPL